MVYYRTYLFRVLCSVVVLLLLRVSPQAQTTSDRWIGQRKSMALRLH
jgi:hypothetical protein